MNLAKSFEFFDPSKMSGRVHIIGCGSVGSTLAENLARLGITRFTLYDFDVVESHNIANQMFVAADINKPKVEAVAEMIKAINPDIPDGDIILQNEGYINQNLDGYVFLCVDSIETRKQICTAAQESSYVKMILDIRTGLTFAQHYAADWKNIAARENLLKTMNFTHEEAKAEEPVSACNVTLSVCPTIRIIVGYAVANFMNFVIKNEYKKFIQADAFSFMLDAF